MFGGEANWLVTPDRSAQPAARSKLGLIRVEPRATSSVVAELEQALREPPMKVDPAKLEQLLSMAEEVEDDGTVKPVIKRGLERLEYAKRAQLQVRVAKITTEVEELMKPSLLEIDQQALLEALEIAADTPSVAESLLARGEATLRNAEAAWVKLREQKRREALAALQAAVTPPLHELDPEAIKAAMVLGEEAEVDEETMLHAQAQLRAVTRRNAAASRLEYLISADPDDADPRVLLEAIEEGALSGVTMATVQEAQTIVRETERARAPRHAAAALLANLTSGTPLEVPLDEAEAAMADAIEAAVPNEMIEVRPRHMALATRPSPRDAHQRPRRRAAAVSSAPSRPPLRTHPLACCASFAPAPAPELDRP